MHHMISTFSAAATLSSVAQGLAPPRGAVRLSSTSSKMQGLAPPRTNVRLASTLFDDVPVTPLYRAPGSAFQGMPSTPGWESGRLDELTDWATSDRANRPVMCEYRSEGGWLWSKWRGTVLQMVLVPVLASMSLTVSTDILAHAFSAADWSLFGVPPAEDALISQLRGLATLWEYQLTLTIFVLTFFTQQAYAHYRSVYFCARAIQGRINDVCLLLAVGATRGEVEGATSTYSDDGAALVELCARLIRLCHTFFWATTPTTSDGVGDGGLVDGDGPTDLEPSERVQAGPELLSPQGLRSLVAAGQLTANERTALLKTGLPPSQYWCVLLEWVGQYALEGVDHSALRDSPGFEERLLRELTQIRAEMFSIGDFQAGRMPLAYVQLVQVLVDSLVIIAPVALYAKLGALSIPLCGLLTLFFKGLLELSKSFLDPFGNEGFPGQNIRVDVLVSELNFGAQSRWSAAGAVLPERDRDGPRPLDTVLEYCSAWPDDPGCEADAVAATGDG